MYVATMYLVCSLTNAAVGESVGGSGFDKEASLWQLVRSEPEIWGNRLNTH